MRFVASFVSAAVLFTLAIQAPSMGQDRQVTEPKNSTSQEQAEEDQQVPAPLAVGSMAVASNAALSVEAMSVDVSIDRVTYTYKLRNKSASALSLAASVAEPDLEMNSDGSTTYMLPNDNAESVVGLDVKSSGNPVSVTTQVQAVALGIDRRAALESAGIPLIPFGEATEKALAEAKPDIISKLEGLGLITPRDPSHPDAVATADWSLHVVHGWTQNISPRASAEVSVAFAPIKAVYTIDTSSLAGFDTLKDAACLTPQILNAVKALLAAKGATVDVADVLVANDGPARWLQNPPARVAIHKPTADSLVAFCGLDAKTQKSATVTGTMPNSSEASALRVLIFARTTTQ